MRHIRVVGMVASNSMIDRNVVDRQVVVRRDEEKEHEELREQLDAGSHITIFRVVHLHVANALIEQPLEVFLGANALLAVTGHARQATDILDDAACKRAQLEIQDHRAAAEPSEL